MVPKYRTNGSENKVMILKNKSRNVSPLVQRIHATVFAPSSPTNPVTVKLAIELVKKEVPQLSFCSTDCITEPRTGKKEMAQGSLPYLADKDHEQAEKFTKTMLNSELDLVWCTRGGYGVLRWLKQVQWENIKGRRHPVVLGFSDLTFLHSVSVRHGIPAIHGPLLSTLPYTENASRKLLWQAIVNKTFPTLPGKVIKEGRASGTLIGGNLTCLCHSLATPFEPPWDGSILLLEDHNEAPYRLDRMLTQLKLSGRLERLAGIAIGQLSTLGTEKELIRHLLMDRLGDLKIPVLYDLPIGHGEENYPVFLGKKYKISSDKGVLRPAFNR